MSTFVLWDIDRTLLYAGSVDKEMWGDVCAKLVSRRPSTLVGTSGRTDPQILLEALMASGVDEVDAERLLPDALRLEVELLARRSEDLQARGYPMPGAAAVLAALANEADLVQSVLTGNVRDNARLKLASFGLDRHLDLNVGAFGSDSAHRPSLVPIAQARLRDARGIALADLDTVIVGDSARDVHAARNCQVRSVAVATGRTSAAELATAGADVVLADLTDLDAVLNAIR